MRARSGAECRQRLATCQEGAYASLGLPPMQTPLFPSCATRPECPGAAGCLCPGPSPSREPGLASTVTQPQTTPHHPAQPTLPRPTSEVAQQPNVGRLGLGSLPLRRRLQDGLHDPAPAARRGMVQGRGAGRPVVSRAAHAVHRVAAHCGAGRGRARQRTGGGGVGWCGVGHGMHVRARCRLAACAEQRVCFAAPAFPSHTGPTCF